MQRFPPPVNAELPGWDLEWARLIPSGDGEKELALDWEEAHERFRRRFFVGPLVHDPVVVAVRKLFRAAGCDPTRYRPSSEALARRILKGDLLPRIHPIVDVNNLVSVEMMVPCCVVDASAIMPPLVLRSGKEGETMASMRGPFDLTGKPLLEDRGGAFGTPITDSERVKIGSDLVEAWMVAYTPASVAGLRPLEAILDEILSQAPVAVLGWRSSGQSV